MIEELEVFKKEFKRIKKLGYVKSCRSGEDRILKTFEDYLKKNNINFRNIKLKVKKIDTRNYVKLFKITCQKGEQEIKRLKNQYGEQDMVLKKAKVLNTSVQANCCSLVSARFLFKLDIDYDLQKIYLVVLDRYMNLLERKIYWNFADVKDKFSKKLNNLILIKAWVKKDSKGEFYKFYDYDFYQLRDFNSLVKLLEDGTIRLTFKIGVYRTGVKMGEMADHGINLEIQELDMIKLYIR